MRETGSFPKVYENMSIIKITLLISNYACQLIKPGLINIHNSYDFVLFIPILKSAKRLKIGKLR